MRRLEVRTMTKLQIELAKWWTSLRITDKENLSKCPYPECSRWWNDLSESEQVAVKDAAGIAVGDNQRR